MEEQLCNPASNLKTIKKIGNGCQGEVYQVEQLQTKNHYALKLIKTNKEITSKEKERIQFQIQSNIYLSNNFQSNHFPKLYRYWLDSQSISILFELCEENAQISFKKLTNYSQKYNYLIVFLFDGLQALSILQKLNIIHRDIKPQNILIKNDSFKIADFGLSRVYAKGNTQTNNIGNKLGRSPQFSTGLYTTKTDIWSLAIHVFYLLENTLPFDERSIMMIINNPNQMEKVISSKELQIDLQPSGRRSKNVLSFLHMILSEMIVINPSERSQASKLLQQHFPQNIMLDLSSIVRFCLFGYLHERHSCSQYYLIALCAYVDYYRLDSKTKEEIHSNKRKICLMVKKTILQLMVYFKNHMDVRNGSLVSLFEKLIDLWQSELTKQVGAQKIQQLTCLENALEIYKINKVQQKFPLIEWMVRLFRVQTMTRQGIKCKKILLWDIPIDLYKLL